MSETPRTDAAVKKSLAENGGKFMTEDLLFKCREIEMEMAELTEALGAWKNEALQSRASMELMMRGLDERDELKRQIKSLSEELQRFQSDPLYDTAFDNGCRAAQKRQEEGE